MNLGALWALPRPPVDSLAITVQDRVIEFDVSKRTWPDEARMTSEAESSLIRGEESMVLLRDGSYRWISIKRFRLPLGAPLDPSDAADVFWDIRPTGTIT